MASACSLKNPRTTHKSTDQKTNQPMANIAAPARTPSSNRVAALSTPVLRNSDQLTLTRCFLAALRSA
jgi:hypothetical protein